MNAWPFARLFISPAHTHKFWKAIELNLEMVKVSEKALLTFWPKPHPLITYGQHTNSQRKRALRFNTYLYARMQIPIQIFGIQTKIY